MLDTWGIVVNDPDMFKDIRKAPSDQLSFGHAIAEVYSVGLDIIYDVTL